jgi:flagellar biosynthesis/type III secretory pathway protein FliH
MLNHSWNQKGEYFIKSWAKDTLDGESQQASFKLTILTNDKTKQKTQRNIDPLIIQILEKIIKRFPIFNSFLI